MVQCDYALPDFSGSFYRYTLENIKTKYMIILRCIKDWVGHKRDIYNRNFNLLLFTVYINLCNTFVMK